MLRIPKVLSRSRDSSPATEAPRRNDAVSKYPAATSSPTMIIPTGTEIQVDGHGQLSIRTPGNLVIQNSGHYGVLESLDGSIRVEANAQVEAVEVRCAESCYVQGALTAWKVRAQRIQLDESARANIVLQETDKLEIGREARMVGNFGSEKELFLLFSRFSEQFRSLPFLPGRTRGDEPSVVEIPAVTTGSVGAAADRPTGDELPDPLFFALILLEREGGRSTYGPTSQRVIGEIVKLLQDRDVETLRLTYRTLFERIVEPTRDAKRARELVSEHFDQVIAG